MFKMVAAGDLSGKIKKNAQVHMEMKSEFLFASTHWQLGQWVD